MTKKHAPQYFICSLNFKSHNFQTESHFKCVAPTYRGSTTLSVLVLQLRLTFRTDCCFCLCCHCHPVFAASLVDCCLCPLPLLSPLLSSPPTTVAVTVAAATTIVAIVAAVVTGMVQANVGQKILKCHILRNFSGDRSYSGFKITNYYKRNSETTPTYVILITNSTLTNYILTLIKPFSFI
jgi:hypothetical protein